MSFVYGTGEEEKEVDTVYIQKNVNTAGYLTASQNAFQANKLSNFENGLIFL